MNIPKGAIKTFDELREVVARKKGQLYLSPGWSPKGVFIEGVHVADILQATSISEDNGTVKCQCLGKLDLFNLRHTEPLRLNVSGAFIFTNYWLAWAHYLKSKEHGHEHT